MLKVFIQVLDTDKGLFCPNESHCSLGTRSQIVRDDWGRVSRCYQSVRHKAVIVLLDHFLPEAWSVLYFRRAGSERNPQIYVAAVT